MEERQKKVIIVPHSSISQLTKGKSLAEFPKSGLHVAAINYAALAES